jgi:hypothetical protein
VGALYAVGCVIYFCAAGWEGYRAGDMEHAVARISNDYTNSIQLKARLGVLQERSQLKYAALDCWETVAQELPSSVTLARSSFANGSKLSLSGTVDQTDTEKVIHFYDSLKKAKHKEQPMFNSNPDSGDMLNIRAQGDKMAWSFALELLHSEVQ